MFVLDVILPVEKISSPFKKLSKVISSFVIL